MGCGSFSFLSLSAMLVIAPYSITTWRRKKIKEYFENDEENAPMSDLYHLYYMKKEKCADVTEDIMKKSNESAEQEQPYLIERFDSYCKKVLQFEVMQY